LRRLVRRVRDVVLGADAFTVTKARGYGQHVHDWEELLDTREGIVISAEEVEQLTIGTDEWFYDFEARLSEPPVCYGLHDSTALFIDAPPSIAKQVVSVFDDVRHSESDSL
jgi:hypothetical protein